MWWFSLTQVSALSRLTCVRNRSLFKQYSVALSKRRSITLTACMMAGKDLLKARPTVAVVQMTATCDKETTYQQLAALVERAKRRGAEMIFLPECADYVGESIEQSISLAEPLDGDLVGRYKQLAMQWNVWLSIGGFHQRPNTSEAGKRVYNTHIIIDAGGEIRATYDKTHMFDIDIAGAVSISESSFTVPGTKIGPPVATPVGKIGLGICYDMRFPEMAISLAHQGAEILTYPSAFTVPTGLAHWEVLLRSRAVENQCYVIAAAQVGQHHAKRSSYGHAMIIDPWGAVIAQCHNAIDVAVAEIDLPLLVKRRRDMPVFRHKRADIYGQVYTQARVSIDSQSEYKFGEHVIKSSCVFHRTALSFAFVNRKPVLPGHVLVCSTRVAGRLADCTAAEIQDLFVAVQAVTKAIEKHYGATSATVAVQDGPDSGQTVQHVHVHILPRKPGDFANNDDIYDKLEKHDKLDTPAAWRSESDMATEALALRKYFPEDSRL